jgi:hypothetical protein
VFSRVQAGGFAAQVMELATTCFLKIVIRAKHGHSAIKAWLNDVRGHDYPEYSQSPDKTIN